MTSLPKGHTEIVVYGEFLADGFCRASLDAYFTGDAPGLAGFFYFFPRIFCAASDPNPGIPRNKPKKLLRTDPNAVSAADTRRRIDCRKIIFHVNGMEGTDFRAITKPDAAIATLLRTPKGQVGA